MLWALLILSIGLVLLWKGADLLVGGAVGLAERMGISQLVVGLTIVAMGTSAPEVAASVAAVVGGKGDIAIGNVYGSNIANLALVGGLVALLRPLQVPAGTLRREVPAMLGVALLLWLPLHDLTTSRVDALLLLLVFAVLVIYTVRTARAARTSRPIEPFRAAEEPARTLGRDILFMALGLTALAGGAHMAVYGAIAIGTRIGLSDAVIGSTIMAVGTSLPELVTCVVAAVKGHHDISVGNLVGSNIFNTLLVVGAAGIIHPFTISARFAGGADYWIMIAVSAGFGMAAVLGRRTIGRVGGTVLLATYVGYMVFLLSGTGPV